MTDWELDLKYLDTLLFACRLSINVLLMGNTSLCVCVCVCVCVFREHIFPGDIRVFCECVSSAWHRCGVLCGVALCRQPAFMTL